MSGKLFVGIDTSNYTTSAALCTQDGQVVANIKKLLLVEQGQRGLRQSEALFLHNKNLPEIMGQLSDSIRAHGGEISAVGYSAYPRDIEGSYMPCFLAGRAAAYSLAAAIGAPIYKFSHQAGHIFAALYSSGQGQAILDGAVRHGCFAAFHVSGGTTELLLVSVNDGGVHIEQIGGTRDINAGQAIDRAGVMMGLGFPCGREMESVLGDTENTAPVKICVDGLFCNLSGLENMAGKLYAETQSKAAVSAFVFDFVGRTLLRLSKNLRQIYPDIPILYAGGVMSNKKIKSILSSLGGVYFATPEFSSDNAAGVALLARREYLFGGGQT